MPALKLIATDLDGTVIGDDADVSLFSEFGRLLSTYRERYGTQWVICSGRSRKSIERSIEPLRALHLNPDYGIVQSSFVYENRNHALHPRHRWNFGVRVHMFMSFLYLRGALREWKRDMIKMFQGCTPLYERRNRLCLRFRNREDADAAAAVLRKKAQVFRHLRVYQYLTEVDIRSMSYTKGMAVEALAGRLGVGPSEILCIGDGLSDVSMLDGSVAQHCGCPANAELDVMDVVHQTGGHIATAKGLAGTIEILHAYLTGEVCGDLPPWWQSSRSPKNPRSVGRRHHQRQHPGHAPQRTAIRLGLLAGYAVLVVFASFELVPFSDWIMLPFTVVAKFVSRLMTGVLL